MLLTWCTKIARIALILMSFSLVAEAGVVPVIGQFRGVDGSRIQGNLKFTLSYPATDTCSNNVVAPMVSTFRINNGALQGGAAVVPNDCLAPANTFYLVQLFSSAGALIRQNNFYVSTPVSPATQFDISSAVPTTLTSSNISFATIGATNSVINNRQYCFTGANAGIKITAAIAALPSTGGVVDCSNLQGAQTITTDVFTGITKPIILIFGAASYTVSACLHVPNKWEIFGMQGGTSITFSGALACGFKGDSSIPVGIAIHDLQIFGGGGTQIGIDLSTATVGSDCYDKLGPNLNIEGTTVEAIKLDNCGGSSTYIDGTLIRNLTSGMCIHWSNTGGNTHMYNISCPSGNADTFGSIQASGQIVSITNATYEGFVGTDQIPSLKLDHNYIYPTPGASAHACVQPKAASNMNVLTIVGGYCTGLNGADSYVDGKYGSVNLIGTSAVNGASVSSFFGTSFGGIGGGGTLAVNAIGVDLTAGGTTVTYNLPATAVGPAFGVSQTGARQTYYQGPLSVGANATGTAGQTSMEIHGPTDAFLHLFNTNAAPSEFIVDARLNNLLVIANQLATPGTISIDPGPGIGAQLVIPRGDFVPAAYLFSALPSPILAGHQVFCSDCKNQGDGATVGAQCVNGGTGAMAFAEDATPHWRCF